MPEGFKDLSEFQMGMAKVKQVELFTAFMGEYLAAMSPTAKVKADKERAAAIKELASQIRAEDEDVSWTEAIIAAKEAFEA